MLKVNLILEDGYLDAERDVDEVGKWDVKLMDLPTGTKVRASWSDEQIAAVVALALGGDNIGEKGLLSMETLYEIAEPCFAGVPIECRLIP